MFERPGTEGRPGTLPRVKVSLETPLRGRFWGENRRLLFAPPAWYDHLVLACIFGGGAVALIQLGLRGLSAVTDPLVTFWVPFAVCLAGIWALLSSERMTVDLKARTYTRREGQGLWKRWTRGSLDEIDAIVVTSEVYPVGAGLAPLIIYRSCLHWKQSRQPLLVVDRQEAPLAPGQPINSRAGEIVLRASRYAQAMGIRVFDNSHFASPAPIRPV